MVQQCWHRRPISTTSLAACGPPAGGVVVGEQRQYDRKESAARSRLGPSASSEVAMQPMAEHCRPRRASPPSPDLAGLGLAITWHLQHRIIAPLS